MTDLEARIAVFRERYAGTLHKNHPSEFVKNLRSELLWLIGNPPDTLEGGIDEELGAIDEKTGWEQAISTVLRLIGEGK